MSLPRKISPEKLIDRCINGTLLDAFGNRDDDDLHTLAHRANDPHLKAKLLELYVLCCAAQRNLK